MQVFTRDELIAMAGARQDPSVSIYLPARRVKMEFRQDSLRLKNLLRQAEETLIAGGMRPPTAKALLEPAEKMLSQILFWRGQRDGLAIFLTSDTSHFYQIPLEVPELVVVSERFHLKPLLELFGYGVFYLLALSQNEVRLLQASKYSVSDVTLEGVVSSLAEALKYDEPEQLQFSTVTQIATGERAAMFHGHGVGIDDTKSNLRRFCQQLDRGLHHILRDEQAPLMVAGVENLVSIFLQVSSYPHLLPEGMTGNPEGMSPEELQREAWPVVEPYLNKARQKAEAKYQELDGTSKISHDLKEIVSAAYHGKAEFLFMAAGRQEWGVYDAEHDELRFAPPAAPGAEDLLDAAAIQTMLKGGTVFTMALEAVPEGAPIAAIFRY
jgi:hypothetical protein